MYKQKDLVKISGKKDKFINVKNKFGIRWDNKGTLKLLEDPIDFIFRGENTLDDTLDRIKEIDKLNPGLIEAITIYREKEFLVSKQ